MLARTHRDFEAETSGPIRWTISHEYAEGCTGVEAFIKEAILSAYVVVFKAAGTTEFGVSSRHSLQVRRCVQGRFGLNFQRLLATNPARLVNWLGYEKKYVWGDDPYHQNAWRLLAKDIVDSRDRMFPDQSREERVYEAIRNSDAYAKSVETYSQQAQREFMARNGDVYDMEPIRFSDGPSNLLKIKEDLDRQIAAECGVYNKAASGSTPTGADAECRSSHEDQMQVLRDHRDRVRQPKRRQLVTRHPQRRVLR